MSLFNNLVMFDQHVAQASFISIVPIWRPVVLGLLKTELRFSLHEASSGLMAGLYRQ
jgi:hypothetical protein